MLTIVVLSATFLAPFTARSTSALNAPNGRSKHLMLSEQSAASFEESQVLSASAADEEQRIREGFGGRTSAMPASGSVAASTASFDEAQTLGSQLATVLTESCAAGEPMPADAVETLRKLVSTTSGARGWYVSLLTDERYDAVFEPPLNPELLWAIEASPDPNLKLLTMNIAMSTATELVHVANGSEDLASASRLTRDRSKVLLNALLPRMLGLTEEVRRLRTAVVPWPSADAPPESADKEWVEFTRRWKYGEEQRAAIKSELDEVLAPFDEPWWSDLWKSPEIWAAVGYGGFALGTGYDPVFCPDGPTSAQALVVAKAVTTLALAGWAAYVLGVAKAPSQ
jgi:hypothetical protein